MIIKVNDLTPALYDYLNDVKIGESRSIYLLTMCCVYTRIDAETFELTYD